MPFFSEGKKFHGHNFLSVVWIEKWISDSKKKRKVKTVVWIEKWISDSKKKRKRRKKKWKL